jgi:uncharacterized metal-binding protein YceD (DUF177 family)
MKNHERRVSHTPVIPFTEIPFEGMDLQLSEKFSDLYREDETVDTELLSSFQHPIEVSGSLLPVASKVDLRGQFRTTISGICDRCTTELSLQVEGKLDTFLMAATQFSEHDKPGGKVIHGPTRGVRPSRHHSKSKAQVLTDAEGEHEDENFGAFDGHTIDLRPLIRELLILQIPMKMLCSDTCKGLCVVCAGNINAGKCTCASGPTLVQGDSAQTESPLALALKRIIPR